MSKFQKSLWLIWVLPTVFYCGLVTASPIAYFGLGKAYVLDTQKQGRIAHLASTLGAAEGTYIDDGSTRTVTLSSAIKASIDYQEPGCVIAGTADRYIQQVIFRRTQGTTRKGQSEVVDIGFDFITGGCTVGKRVPFGSPSDNGTSLSHLSLLARPSMSNVRPGSSWAGLHETPYVPMPTPFVIADAVDYLPTGDARFSATGMTVPSTMTADGWWALSLPRGERRYTRLTKADSTGAELWLFGDYANSHLTWAHAWWIVRRDTRANFGDIQSAARQWADERSPAALFTNLYPDSTADRYVFNAATGSWWRDTGWTWTLAADGISLHQTLPNRTQLLRTWSSIKSGSGYQWVLDQTVSNPNSSLPRVTAPRQLVRMNDTGPAMTPKELANF